MLGKIVSNLWKRGLLLRSAGSEVWKKILTAKGAKGIAKKSCRTMNSDGGATRRAGGTPAIRVAGFSVFYIHGSPILNLNFKSAGVGCGHEDKTRS